jgi:bifunctional DNA-binding transcriptional regulator/antitoxin component of YhaV-PrlF toxin-antitoxin module
MRGWRKGTVMVSTQVVARDEPVVLPDDIARAAGVEPGATLVIESTAPGRIEIRVLPMLTLEEFLQRFRIDLPYDESAIRKAAEDDAAEEAFGHSMGPQNG